MHIRVKMFAVLREAAGIADASLDLSEGVKASDAVSALCKQFPAIAPFRDRIVIAVNMHYVSRDHRLSDGDELALIPPVSGG